MTKRRSISIALSLAAASAAIAEVPRATTVVAPEKARNTLLRVLTAGEMAPMTAIIVQRTAGAHETIQIKVQQDANGRRKCVVLGPLSMQGSVSLDDGQKWVNFCPDTSKMIVAPSARDERVDPEVRLKLATQNYRFAIETNTEVAGRPATVVVAIPRFTQMPTRRIAVDNDRAVLLRIEAIRASGERELLYDTRSIDFQTSFGANAFKVATPARVQVVKVDPPMRVQSAAQAKGLVGFTPIFPKAPRFGFSLREAEVVGPRSNRYVALRLTDGIVSSTIYQWNAKDKLSPIGPDMDGVDRVIGGTAIRVVGELPRDVRLKIVEGMANELGKTFRPIAEPVWTAPALKPRRDPQIVCQPNATNDSPSIFELLIDR